MNKLASGNGWELSQDGNTILLELKSIYGTVGLKVKDQASRKMFHDVLTEYVKLKEQGPIEQDGSGDVA